MKKQREVEVIKEAIEPTILRPKDACLYLGMNRVTLHHLHERDPSFPRKIQFSPGCVGWRKKSLDAWLDQKEKNGGI